MAAVSAKPKLIRRRSPVSRRKWWGLVFVLPVVIFFIVFSIIPIINGFYLSLTDFSLLKPPRFIGLDNFVRIFNDAQFRDSVVVTIKFVTGSTIPVWLFSLLAAVLFFQKFPGRGIIRSLFYTPLIPTSIIIAILWKLLLNPNGIVTHLLYMFTGQAEIRWLNDLYLSPLSMILMNDWATIPFFAMIWLAALTGIPDELREAASVDGASRIESFFLIELPLLRPTAIFIASISMIQSFQAFTLQYVISPDRGGPVSANLTMGLLIWKYGFQQFKMGQAAAVSVILCLIILGITALQLWWGRSDDHSIT